jgi:hypothetical protein
MSSLFSTLGSAASSLGNAVGSGASAVGSGLASAGEGLWSGLQSAGSAIGDGLGTAASAIGEGASSAYNGVGDLLSSAYAPSMDAGGAANAANPATLGGGAYTPKVGVNGSLSFGSNAGGGSGFNMQDYMSLYSDMKQRNERQKQDKRLQSALALIQAGNQTMMGRRM